MRRWLIALTSLLFLGVFVLAVLYLVFAHPWLAGPDADVMEIEQRWHVVAQLAEPGEACYGDADRIVAASRTMEQVDQDLRDELARAEEWPPQIDHEELPLEFDQALMHLLQWHLDGGGLDVTELEEQVSLLDTFELGKAALSSAASVERELVDEAVLHLAWTYRECGPMVHGMVGIVPALVDPERELLMLKQFWGDRLEEPATDPTNTDLLVEAFEGDDTDDLPHSLLVRIIGQGTGHLVEQLAVHAEEYDAFLASAPPPDRE